jgi:hypothetical protein
MKSGEWWALTIPIILSGSSDKKQEQLLLTIEKELLHNN